jgi:hypothetical protein
MAAFVGFGINLDNIDPTFSKLPLSPPEYGDNDLPRGRDGVGRERGYPPAVRRRL